jgi:nitroreductase
VTVIEALMGRRTIQTFRSDPLPAGILEMALEAAIRAPNHKLTNPWRFTQVGAKSRKDFVDFAAEAKFGGAPSERQREMVAKKLESAAVFLIVSQVIDADPFRRREDYAAIACAIQNLSLALWAEGVGSKWSTGPATRDPRTYDLLSIDPAIEEIVGVVLIGYATSIPETPRRPLSEVFRTVE